MIYSRNNNTINNKYNQQNNKQYQMDISLFHHECTQLYSFNHHRLTLILAGISNHMSSKAWNEITYHFLNFNYVFDELCDW